MRLKRRKVLLTLGLVILAAVCLPLLWPRDEPKYQSRYLSEWMQRYRDAMDTFRSPGDNASMATAKAQAEESGRAVLAIGTNAVPYFIKWMGDSPLDRERLAKLPQWIGQSYPIRRWLVEPARARFANGYYGILMLGTNAVGAIPALDAMMRDRTRPQTAYAAIVTLRVIGAEAIPVLKDAFADPQQVGRIEIVRSLGWLALDGHTNDCLPLIIAALDDSALYIRIEATNTLVRIAPQLVPNALPVH